MPDNWQSTWDMTVNKPLPSPSEQEQLIVKEAKAHFKICVAWEAQTRLNFEYDYKFANGDSHNKYQWDNDLVIKREGESRPCLTVNKIAQHNLMVINDSKQNKPGIRIRPVGEDASYDAAQLFQELVYHTEYISSAENIYDSAMTFQVQAGIGYWRIDIDKLDQDSFDKEIFIKRIKDPRSVYLDPNITEIDGSDANFGFIFDDIAKDIFKAEYPDYASIASQSVMGESGVDGWISQNNVRVCEYFKKKQKKDKLITWTTQDGKQIIKRKTKLTDEEKEEYDIVTADDTSKRLFQYKEEKVITDDIHWYKIAGDRIIDDGPWIGKYIPIVRLPGVETIIDGVMDRKGHTRMLIDPQRQYNWNASADVEYGALQTKIPWVAPMAAIEGFEKFYETANSVNLSYLPYNHRDEDGEIIPPPQRPAAPQAGPAYVQRMQASVQEMMMASGQYQSQSGENENAKSGVAINARQRQGDRATYHFLDNQAIAIRFTGKILLDLYPKVYDTKRIMRFSTRDGTVMNVTIDPNAERGFQEIPTQEQDANNKVKQVVLNPNKGIYDIQSDTGPSYATRRMEAFAALTQMAQSDKEFMHIGGDLVFKVADFPEADILAQRWRRSISPAILGDTPDPQAEQAMHMASDKIQQLTGLIQQQAEELKNRDREFKIKEDELEFKRTHSDREIKLEAGKSGIAEDRGDYEAETKRLTAIANAGKTNEGVPMKSLKPLLEQLLATMKDDNLDEDRKEIEEPPVPGARKAKDNNWYVEHEPGKFARVE